MQVSRLLQYSPVRRYTALQALTHPFFDELRDQSVTLPNGEPPCCALPVREASWMCCPHMSCTAKLAQVIHIAMLHLGLVRSWLSCIARSVSRHAGVFKMRRSVADAA